MDPWLADLTTELLWAPDIAAARDGFRRLAEQAGVETYAYANCDGAGGFTCIDATYSKDWVDYYVSRDYPRIDPVVMRGHNTQLPFAWRFVVNRPGLDAAQQQLFSEAADFGICDGLTFPFHGKRGCMGLMSVAFSSSQRLRETVQAQPKLRLLALYYHSAIERLLEEQEESPGLTGFERRCLTWAAAGRSLWEISAVTNRAEADVAGALRAVRQKLGVGTTAQAVATAIGQGLIEV